MSFPDSDPDSIYGEEQASGGRGIAEGSTMCAVATHKWERGGCECIEQNN
jgi:hypothetical protein